jgi:dienelactone hydrolase
MKHRLFIIVMSVGISLIVLAIPALIPDPSMPSLVGPDISEMDYADVRFSNPEGPTLAGMLFVPQGDGPFPVAVVIHGSGSSRRNSRWYLGVTDALLKQDIAVLLPDKRGCEFSEGEWRGIGFQELATDTEAALEYLYRQNMFTPESIGLIGMSQGGWIAPIVASGDRQVDYVISFSGSPVTTNTQLEHEEYNNIRPYTWKFIARLAAPLTTRRLLKTDVLGPLADFDPMPYWTEVDVPVFFAFGGDDTNVPVERSVERLDEYGDHEWTIRVYPEGGHGIQDPDTGEISEIVLQDIGDFINDL